MKKNPNFKKQLTLLEMKELVEYFPESGIFIWKVQRKGPNRPNTRAGDLHKETGYRRIGINGIRILEHRLAWFFVHGKWTDKLIDHINGDRADNRILNLREANHSENLQNVVKPRRNNSTGVLGVAIYRGKYVAQIHLNYKNHYLGAFDTLEEAARARNEGKKKFHSIQSTRGLE